MDDYLSLRSLEGIGRPSGTGRSSSSPTRNRTQNERSSEREIVDSPRKTGQAESDRPDRVTKREQSEFSRELDQAETRHSGSRVESAEHSALQPKTASASESGAELAPRGSNEGGPSDSRKQSLRSDSPPAPAGAEEPDSNSFEAAPLVALPAPSVTSPAPGKLAAQAAANPTLTGPVVIASGSSPAPALSGAPGLEGGTTNISAGNPALEIAAPADAGSFSLDTSAGGLANAEGELPLSTSNAIATEGVRFEQALAEANLKTQTSPVQDLETVESVLKQFKVAIDPKMDRAVIQLNPAELGRIAVRIEMDRGKLRAVMRADRPETLELLERHAPELRAALESNGVDAESFDFGLGLDQQDEQAQAELGEQGATNQPNPALEHLEERTALARRIVSDSAVDTYA